MNTVEAARGRWYSILTALGVDESYITGKHGPCPICGGKDRFRWDNKDDTGGYYCNQCGPGDGILLLRKLHGWDFRTAAKEVDRIIGRQPERQPAYDRSAASSKDDHIQKILGQATNPEIVENYLRSRGLRVIPSALKGHASLAHYQDGKPAGRYPAMIAPLRGADGRLRGVHRTYIADVNPRRKLIAGADGVRGAAVRLFDHAGVLGIAEGIETAIAARELFGLPVWAAISTSGMASWEPPLGVVKVTILADHDKNFAGHKAAYTLANRLALAGIGVQVKVPPEPGTDWNDVLLAQPDRCAS